ncbi:MULTISPECIES: PIN domain-containing protein [unclassified Streptomyces]|uniref:PIN domain-containing protein n=1 Tax=unclassified Streptomyces TaxID=2593676 RepID=UPI00037FA4CD|nr:MULTISPECIES: PIN domain-containing protein [unclassified Streptomyces]MYX34384.1 hypothetical protein [Streptomyces sp. SID8377]
MLISALPSTNRENLCKSLAEVHALLQDVRAAGPGPARSRLFRYLEWASKATDRLRHQISPADIDRLVLTRRYELLLSSFGSSAGASSENLVNSLVTLETDERSAAFEEAMEALNRQITRWIRPAAFVVADSSFYIQHPEKLEEADLAAICNLREEPIHLLFPMVVVDELDGLKQSNKTRWRAGYTLAVLDRILGESGTSGTAILREEDYTPLQSQGIPRGEITVEILFDPPGHRRLPINDDEIIDRALAIQPYTGSVVTLLTYDTGQATRARAAGLRFIKLRDSAGEGPEPAKA